MIRDTLIDHITQAIATAQAAGDLPQFDALQPGLSRGRVDGVDYASNVAMQLARVAKMPPAKIAEVVVKHLRAQPALAQTCAVSAANGYINFALAADFLAAQVEQVLAAGAAWGNVNIGKGHKAQVEHGSANPTGYATIGTARNVIVGDTLANTLDAAGYDTHREWYVNDAGSQVRTFGASVFAHYAQYFGKDEPLPPKGYPGDDVVQVAHAIANAHGEKFLALQREQAMHDLGELGIEAVMARIKATMARLGIRFDNFFSERSLYTSGLSAKTLDMLRAKGLILEHDGATWFSEDGSPIRKGQGSRKTDEEYAAYVEEADADAEPEAKGKKLPVQAVVVRSAKVIADPEARATYFSSDIPYVWNKTVLRGFNPAVYVWGEDHQADVERVYAAARALGVPENAPRILIYRFITLLRNGEEVRMGKRKGNAIWIDDVLDEIGSDALRFIMLSRSIDTKFAFDLGLLKEQNDANPVYYVQYGHARICSIARRATEEGWAVNHAAAVKLEQPTEQALIRKILEFPEYVELVASSLQPHHYTTYARELAQAFSKFYDECRIKDSLADVAGSRLKLARAAQHTLARVLGLMGMTAPERM